MDRTGLLTVVQAAQYLQISRSSLYRLIASGQLPTVRIGRSRRVCREDLDAFIAQARDERLFGRGDSDGRAAQAR
jgi:excisionase family DNA binding protein